MTLHEAIEKLLRQKGRAMTTTEIASDLNKNKWYQKRTVLRLLHPKFTDGLKITQICLTVTAPRFLLRTRLWENQKNKKHKK